MTPKHQKTPQRSAFAVVYIPFEIYITVVNYTVPSNTNDPWWSRQMMKKWSLCHLLMQYNLASEIHNKPNQGP